MMVREQYGRYGKVTQATAEMLLGWESTTAVRSHEVWLLMPDPRRAKGWVDSSLELGLPHLQVGADQIFGGL